jgi:hypothetical protein
MTVNKENLPFGKRFGFAPIEIPFQASELDSILRTELWNAIYIFILRPLHDAPNYSEERYLILRKIIWVHFFIKPLDEFPKDYYFDDDVKKFVEKSIWYKIYELIEFILLEIGENNAPYDYNDFVDFINRKLNSHNSAYTVINGRFVQITNTEEISEINTTQELAKNYGLTGIQEHLRTAIDLYAKKPTPDYRNSIKESISMVEVISRIIEPENTLGKALKKLERNGHISSTLKDGFEKLYAYTNDKNGIRHGLMEERDVDVADARYFLVSCSAFTNYLIEKARNANLIKF